MEEFLSIAQTRRQCLDNYSSLWASSEDFRCLSTAEVQVMEQDCSCSASDWTGIRIRAPESLDLTHLLPKLLSNVYFANRNLLLFDSLDSSQFKYRPGIHNCNLVSGCIISLPQVCVHSCRSLEQVVVEERVQVLHCGEITASGPLLSRLKLQIGAESGGGRNLKLLPEATMMPVSAQLCNKAPFIESAGHGELVPFSILSTDCLVRDTPKMDSVFLHSHARVEAALSVENAILLPKASITNGCTASNVFLQWGASISDRSSVSDTLLMEHASAGPSSIVAESVLGPDVHVSAGEIHSSVLGPNTNAHHQSLVIGTTWLSGRGNVGYGANVGSNHTGRLPDQECVAGEGVFWGLSCVIKFPVDLSRAPYSVVAAGTTLTPQRITMPFSLIVTTGDSTKPSIVPGWVYRSSAYTLVRNEIKFETRRKAKRHSFYTGWRIFRPSIIEQCRRSRATVQVDNTPSGVGSCTLTEKGKQIAIESYTECIQLFALRGLYSWILSIYGDTTTELSLAQKIESELGIQTCALDVLDNTPDKPSWPCLPWEEDLSPKAVWSYQRALIWSEFPRPSNDESYVKNVLTIFVQLEEQFADRVASSKQRDDVRGNEVIPDYAACHVLAAEDEVIIQSRAASETKKMMVSKWLCQLEH